MRLRHSTGAERLKPAPAFQAYVLNVPSPTYNYHPHCPNRAKTNYDQMDSRYHNLPGTAKVEATATGTADIGNTVQRIYH